LTGATGAGSGIFLGVTDGNIAFTANGNLYIGPFYDFLNGNTTESTVSLKSVGTVTVNTLKVVYSTATTAAFTATLMVNGSASTVTCTVASGSQTCSDTSHSVTITAGQSVSLRVAFGASTPGAKKISWSASG